tara:strand:+ start:322 stop:783 length:462 start_codon:yes stop_codon:yes gene_type:complete
MKKIILLINVLLLSIVTFAQNTGEAPLSAGQKQINFGVGFGHGIPLWVAYDIAVHRDITVSPNANFNLDGFDWLGLGCKGDYHFNRLIGIPSNFDFYAGLNLGYFIVFDGGSSFDINGQMGGRYYWSEKWGVNLEFGGGSNSWGALLGVSKKF